MTILPGPKIDMELCHDEDRALSFFLFSLYILYYWYNDLNHIELVVRTDWKWGKFYSVSVLRSKDSRPTDHLNKRACTCSIIEGDKKITSPSNIFSCFRIIKWQVVGCQAFFASRIWSWIRICWYMQKWYLTKCHTV